MKLAASYVRVSTEEQAMKGYSIEAQRDAIRQYAKENGYLIVREYSDEGVSGKKPYSKRPALSQFMDDIQGGNLKVDVLLFCKLDRFYRSVKLYYQAVEILDRCGVAWKAILENYETETANGRFTVNIMLSVAENEADRTSERIKFVFENRVQKGQVISGRLPIGYKIVDHKFAIDQENAQIVRDLFRQYQILRSPYAANQYLYKTYGLDMAAQSIFNILRNKTYIGYFRGNPNFCEPIIPVEEFNQVQELLKSRGIRRNQTGQVFIFSGLMICANCGRHMAGNRQASKGRVYLYYKCNSTHFHVNLCNRKKRIREDYVENWMLEHIEAELENQMLEAEAKAQEQKRKAPDRAAVLRKLNRLKDLYVNEVIDLEQYKADYAQYMAQLTEADAAAVSRERTPDFKGHREKMAEISKFYQDLSAKERQSFWQGMIREIRVDPDDTLHIFFR